MRLRVYDSADKLALESACALRDAIVEKPDLLCCFAAGRTQIPTYAIIADWVQKGELDVSRIRVVGLDEIVGASRAKREGFYHFLDRYLFGPAGISDAQIVFPDAQSEDMRGECARIDAWLDEHGPIDFLLLGIGENGHIGYNEPGSRIDSRTHTVELELSSVEAGRTYFDHVFSSDQGVTLGLRDLLAARRVLVQALGAGKSAAIASLRRGVATTEVPVTLLLQSKNEVDYFVDREAAGQEG